MGAKNQMDRVFTTRISAAFTKTSYCKTLQKA
jgi:hypothetical protein